MGKVSIGLRGWRFDEDDVFTEEGSLRPLGEMSEDARERVSRLTALVGEPCDACWLLHGDEDLAACTAATVVYGEPLAEVLLCDEHEAEFVYWFQEAGGADLRGEPELPDAFHEWFAAGNRAPEGFGGVEHVLTEPEDLPDATGPDPSVLNVELPEEERERIDLRNMKVHTGADADRDRNEDVDVDEADVDLSRDYPS
jgi:hypothetical protein